MAVLALFVVGSFAGQNNPNPTNDDSLYEGKKWVVLVAGSKGWSNYRHQVFKSFNDILNNLDIADHQDSRTSAITLLHYITFIGLSIYIFSYTLIY